MHQPARGLSFDFAQDEPLWESHSPIPQTPAFAGVIGGELGVRLGAGACCEWWVSLCSTHTTLCLRNLRVEIGNCSQFSDHSAVILAVYQPVGGFSRMTYKKSIGIDDCEAI